MTTLSLTTELGAINTMLDAIGASPVSSLEEPSIDVAKARAVLDQVNREVQLQGWHFNTDTEYTLPRTTSGEYLLPPNVLRIDTSAVNGWVDVTWRGGKLWDRERHTYTFSADRTLKFDIIWLLPFNDLPEVARNYIAMRAARRFQERMVGSELLSKFDERDEAQALMFLKEAEGENADYNILNGSWGVARVLNRDASSIGSV